MSQDEIRRLFAIRMSLPPEQRAEIERLYAELVQQPADAAWRGSSPADLNAADAASVDIPEDPSLDRARSGLYANLPPIDAAPATAPESAEPMSAPVDTSARQRELVARGAGSTDAEMARVIAEAELADPMDPMSDNPTTPGVRDAIDQENRRRAGMPQPISDGEMAFNGEVAESDRQMANIRRLIRAGVNPAQDMTAASPEEEAKFATWAKSGSLDRMERYAPEEFERRDNAAREQRWKDNRQEYLNRWDFTKDEATGKTQGELYRIAQNMEDKARLRQTDPQANRALARQLEQMGIDSAKFGDWRSDSFAREGALDAKNRAMASGELGGRYGAVQRRAQLRQNPAEYLGRPDISDAQRRTLSFLMSGGKGATANDVEALNAKMLLEGIGQGVDRGMRIGNMDMKEELAAIQLQEQRVQRASQEADAFYAKRRGWGGSLDAEAYSDLIAMLTGMGLSDAQAQGLARRYKRSGGRAERTAPPAK